MMPASFYHEKFQRKVPQCVLMHANCCDRLIVAQGSFAGYVVMLGHACASYIVWSGALLGLLTPDSARSARASHT